MIKIIYFNWAKFNGYTHGHNLNYNRFESYGLFPVITGRFVTYTRVVDEEKYTLFLLEFSDIIRDVRVVQENEI